MTANELRALASELEAWSARRYRADADPYSQIFDPWLAGLYAGHDEIIADLWERASVMDEQR